MDRALPDAIISGQRGPGSNGNEGGAPYSPKPQHYWNLTIRLFGVIYRKLVGGGILLLCRDATGVFYSHSRLSNNDLE